MGKAGCCRCLSPWIWVNGRLPPRPAKQHSTAEKKPPTCSKKRQKDSGPEVRKKSTIWVQISDLCTRRPSLADNSLSLQMKLAWLGQYLFSSLGRVEWHLAGWLQRLLSKCGGRCSMPRRSRRVSGGGEVVCFRPDSLGRARGKAQGSTQYVTIGCRQFALRSCPAVLTTSSTTTSTITTFRPSSTIPLHFTSKLEHACRKDAEIKINKIDANRLRAVHSRQSPPASVALRRKAVVVPLANHRQPRTATLH